MQIVVANGGGEFLFYGFVDGANPLIRQGSKQSVQQPGLRFDHARLPRTQQIFIDARRQRAKNSYIILIMYQQSGSGASVEGEYLNLAEASRRTRENLALADQTIGMA